MDMTHVYAAVNANVMAAHLTIYLEMAAVLFCDNPPI